MVNQVKDIILKSATVVAIALSCAVFGVGIGFVQGEIVARRADKIEQVAFAGGAAMIGGLVALALGPILFYALNRRLLFDQFCYIVVFSSVVGCVAGWLLSLHPNGPGWVSMFVTPIAAIFFAILFARK
jgi:hypothetical protein